MTEQKVSIVAILRDQFTGPGARVRKELGDIQNAAGKLGSSLSPIFNKLNLFIGSIASVGAASKAIQAAEEESKAQQRLLTALKGRDQAQQRILATAEKLEKTTFAQSEQLIEQAATLKQMGVNADLIPDALEAATSTAAALGLEIGQVSTDIGKLAIGGDARGLQKLIPELKDLQAEGAGAAEIIGFLKTRFEGAEKAATNTDFGKLHFQFVTLEDLGKRAGNVLVKFQSILVSSVTPAVEALVGVIESDEFKVFLEVFKEAAPVLVKVAAGVAAVGAGFALVSAGKVLIGIFTSAVALVGKVASTIAFGIVNGIISLGTAAVAALGPFAGLLAVITAIGAAVLTISGGMERIAKLGAFAGGNSNRIASSMKEVIDAIGKGELGINDLFDLLETRIELAKLDVARSTISGRIFAGEIDEKRNKVILDFEARQRASHARLQSAAIEAASKEVKIEQDKQSKLLTTIESFDKQVARSREFASNLFENSRVFDIGVEQARKLLATVAADAQEPLREVLGREFELQFEQGRISAEKYIAFREELEVGFFRKQIDEQDALIAKENEKLKTIEDQRRELDKSISAISKNISNRENSKNAQEFNPNAILSLNNTLLNLEKDRTDLIGKQSDVVQAISVAEKQRAEAIFNAFKAEQGLVDLRKATSEQRLQLFTKNIEQQQNIAKAFTDDLSKGFIGFDQAFAQFEENISGIKTNAVAAREEVERLLAGQPRTPGGSQPELTKTFLDAIDTLTKLKGSVKELAAGFAVATSEALGRAADVFQNKLKDIAARATAGEIFGIEAINEEKAALEEYLQTLSKIADQLELIKAKHPELTKLIDDLQSKIQGVQSGSTLVGSPGTQGTDAGSFFGGIVAGAKQASSAFDDMGKAGAQLGATLTNSLADGLVDIWIRGTGSMRQFAANFFQLIASMIAKMLIFKLIAAGIGLIGGAFAGGATTDTAGFDPTGAGSVNQVPNFAEGGLVPGPNINADIIDGKLTPGEFVFTKEAVDAAGVDNIIQLHKYLANLGGRTSVGMVPSIGKEFFNDGGPVGAGVGSGMNRAYVPPDEQALDRMLKGGAPAFFRFFEENADELSPILDRRRNRS